MVSVLNLTLNVHVNMCLNDDDDDDDDDDDGMDPLPMMFSNPVVCSIPGRLGG